jgi:hypothetical protein
LRAPTLTARNACGVATPVGSSHADGIDELAWGVGAQSRDAHVAAGPHVSLIETLAALGASLVLAAVHALSPAIAHLPRRYRALSSSVSGGVGLAYVFLYLLFELARYGAPKIHAAWPLAPDPLESLFVLLLAALSLTFLLQARFEASPDRRDDHFGNALLFVVYNGLAGTGVVEEARGGTLNLALYVTALGLHLLFNDVFLTHLWPGAPHARWRLALAAAPVAGCALAAGFALSDGVLYTLLALIAGAMIMNVLRHELPSARDVRPLAFLFGVGLYAALIIGTWRF